MRHSLGVILLLVVGSVQANVIHSQAVDESINGLYSWVRSPTSQRVTDNFILSDSYTIESLSWYGGYVASGVETDAHEFRISIYEDAGGAPGTTLIEQQFISTTGSLTGLSNNASGALYEYSAALNPFVLTSGGNYWIEIVENDLLTSGAWAIAESAPTSQGVHYRSSDADSWSNGAQGTRGELAFTVSGTVVPIPAAVWLFGSGLGLLGWFRRRRIV